ncbi:E1-like protein-activating [Rhizopogon vinicolor AM-OR11-026]|uniref:Ubiquitin-like modifier-activating enzyme ATG7 n=1 Tax=Rhizopogon vinicolor AM-OR11-026 TaxID=1314800 RepID=A0A1B7N8N7_9AGAM|nr:E1-like protein-activating [Rhizopogon vinicolor AM-OR11-026]
MPVVQFAPFASLVQPGFWHELTRMKIDVLRLSDEALTVSGSYSVGRSIRDRETGQDIALGCNLIVGEDAYQKASQLPPMSVAATGVFKNYNTIEDFKAADKAALCNDVASKIWDSIISTKNTSLLTQFLLITFADLKKYQYVYWFAFPAFVSKPAWEISESGWKPAQDEIKGLESIYDSLHKSIQSFFLVKEVGDIVVVGSVEQYDAFFAGVAPENRIIGFLDPSALPENPGWPLRNLLTYLRVVYPSQTSSIRVLCWRDSEKPIAGNPWKSRFGVVTIREGDPTAKPSAIGWERLPTTNKLSARVADLAPMMDPRRLADQAVDLNLKLMRWRILPSLDLDKVASTRCLLLGAGTLGCYVARTLMGWGVRKITFIDSARVSFSNPVRQPLFEFEDCLNGGKPKAACAAERLTKIFPGINATGHDLSIPMPGHPIPPESIDQAKKDVVRLERLFDEHDVVFLLMDSRESRWLPTVLGAAKGKIVINAALGFDTYLVMRHGARASTSTGTRLGCYYCNDIVAPADSLTDRTLDQMCTVTRPGLASIAASTAVELLVSLLQHPDGLHAPPPPPQTGGTAADPSTSGSVLGLVPHQLRGFLAQFRNLLITGAAYDKCTGCSETVLKAYEEQGFDMLLTAFNEPGYLESLTGLDKLYNEGDAALESVDWEDSDEDD